MSRVTRSNAAKPKTLAASALAVVSPRKAPALAVVSPRKRTKPPTPPTVRRTTNNTRSRSQESSESVGSNTSDETRVVSKVTRRDALYHIKLEKVDYYTLLNVGRNATRADVSTSANYLSRIYKKRDTNEDGNSLESIQHTIGNAVQVLSNIHKRKIYNTYLDEKLKIHDYFVEKLRPLHKTATEIYNGALRLRNDAVEFFEMDIAQILQENVYNTIERSTKNKHYKTTKTNRLRIEWQVDQTHQFDNGGVDENYLEKYFENDGLVGVVMCGARRGCAVIELMTYSGVKSIIERENKRKRFTVRDYTEAEFGIDHTNYSPLLDRFNLIRNDLDESEQQINAQLENLKSSPSFNINLEENVQMEWISGNEDDDDDDDDDEDEYLDFNDDADDNDNDNDNDYSHIEVITED